ncbi:MAG: hypothetical protein DRJ03_19065 [Chloroflexi bacterium]|nr:MAG: hypothetical protein DRJ03_19065 [Chloroflexota bacterium]
MGRITLDGTEQTLFESTELAEYFGYVFLNNLEDGDTVVIRVYIRDVEDSKYYLADEKSFSNAQAIPVVRITNVIGKVGIKITIQQTAGTYRDVDHMWFRKG